MRTKPLFSVTAVFEAGTGLALLVSPALVASVLIGAPFGTLADSVVGRVAGAALLALGLACWLARDDGPSRAAAGLIGSMLFYNVATIVVLAFAGLGWRLIGVGLWPAVVLHALMAVWCLACLRESLNRSEPREQR
jgi:hypothetical protein